MIVCVELGKSPMETKQLLERHIVVAVFPEPWSIDGTDGFHNIPRPNKLKNDWKTYCNHGSLTLNVLISLQDVACQTVRVIALRNNIAVTSSNTIFTDHMYIISGFSGLKVYIEKE